MGNLHRVHGAATTPRMSGKVGAKVFSTALRTVPARRPWKRSLAWLIFLGPFFFISYGFANWWTEARASPGALVFEWEAGIPFVAWTIVPYWSIDLLYGLSFLLCRNRQEVDCHAHRLLGAQIIAVACFIVHPLRFTFEKPGLGDSVFSALYAALAEFDTPFNQAPSLHIALLVILWVRYAASTRGFVRQLVNLWAVLICISVLTTYQHHFIDLPTGALLGLSCLWMWPEHGPGPFASWKFSAAPRRRLGIAYLVGASCCAALAPFGGVFLWALWPAFALLLVSLAYFGLGPDGFQKREGQFSLAARWLLAPYVGIAWLNSRIWTFRHPQPDEIADGVWLGRMPGRQDMLAGRFVSLLDLTAELSAPRGPWTVRNLPWLDLVAPDAEQLRRAAVCLESLRSEGRLLVCCALGYSRGASAIAAWLLLSGRAPCIDEAIAVIAAHRPRVMLSPGHRAMLRNLQMASAGQPVGQAAAGKGPLQRDLDPQEE